MRHRDGGLFARPRPEYTGNTSIMVVGQMSGADRSREIGTNLKLEVQITEAVLVAAAGNNECIEVMRMLLARDQDINVPINFPLHGKQNVLV